MPTAHHDPGAAACGSDVGACTDTDTGAGSTRAEYRACRAEYRACRAFHAACVARRIARPRGRQRQRSLIVVNREA